MVSINRNIVGCIKYLVIIVVVIVFVSYCYSYCDFVRTFSRRHWFVVYVRLFLEQCLFILVLSRSKYRSG